MPSNVVFPLTSSLRAIGRQRFTLEGASNDRAIQPCAQWMFQRPLRFHQQLPQAARMRLMPLLQPVGGRDALDTIITTLLEYVGHGGQLRRI